MSKKEMIQWAPGTKPQRMSRVLDEDYFRQMIERGLRNSKRGIPRNDKVDIIKPGDWVWFDNRVYEAGEVDYEAKSVMLGIHKHGMNCVRRMPDWAVTMYKYIAMEANKIEFDHRVEVIEVYKEPHPNAKDLSVVTVFGKPVIVRSTDFEDGETAAYVPPDSRILSNDPYYSWLGRDKRRVRVRKYRGVKSHGLIVPCDESFPVGTDVSAFLEICHYKSTEPRNA